MKIQAGHSGAVTGMDLSADGRYLVTAGMDEQTIVWDVRTTREIITLPSTKFVAIYPDSKRFIMESAEKYYFDVRELPSGKILKTLNLPWQENFYELRISNDGKYMATSMGEVYDAETGASISSLQTRGTVWDINFSADSKYIITGVRWAEAEVFETLTGNSVKRFNNHETGTNAACFSIDGKHVFTAFNNIIKQWNFQTGQLVRSITATGEVTSLEPSADGKTLLSSSYNSTAQLIDLSSGTIKKTYGKAIKQAGGYASFLKDQQHILVHHADAVNGAPVFKIWRISDNKKAVKEFASQVNYVSELTYNADNPQQYLTLEQTDAVNVNGTYMRKARAVSVWDLSKGKIIKTYNLNNLSFYIIQDILFNNDGIQMIVALKEGAYVLFDVVKNKVVREFFSADFNQETYFLKDKVVVKKRTKEYPGEFVKLDMHDLKTGQLLLSWPAHTFQGNPAYFSDGGKYAFAFGQNYKPYLYDLHTGKLIRDFERDEKVSLGFYGDMMERVEKSFDKGMLTFLSIPDLYTKFSAPFEIINQWDLYQISASGKFFVSTREKGKVIQLWSIENNQMLHEFRMPEGIANFFRFSPDEKLLLISDQYLYNFDSREFVVLKDYKYEGFSPDGKYLLSSGSKMKNWGKIATMQKYHSLVDGSEIFSLVSIKGYNSDFVAFTPDGYYFTTKKATENVHYVKDGKIFLFDQFDFFFNRPDIVLSRMGYADGKLIDAYRKAFDKRRKKLGISKAEFTIEELFQVPEVRITSNTTQSSTTTRTYTLSIEGSDPAFAIDKVNVWVNGVPQFGKAGLVMSTSATKLQKTFAIDLNSGLNKIEVSVVNAIGVESLKETFEISFNPTAPVKPDLYVVSIGVSDFAEDNFDLTYAAKDSKDFCNAYKSKTDLFNKINMLSFADSMATVANILRAKETLMKSKPDDVVILFVASHGLLDKNLDYYLATQRVNFSNPEEGGLPYEKFEALIDSIPARKRVLFLDACHSGEVDKDDVVLADVQQTSASIKTRGFKAVVQKESVGLDNSFELMQSMFADLKKGTGAIVISSASGTEFAFESPQWKNGVFTFSLLEGLTSKKADADKDGRIQISEVKDYVTKRVIELTNGQQHPTSRTENLEVDFVIW